MTCCGALAGAVALPSGLSVAVSPFGAGAVGIGPHTHISVQGEVAIDQVIAATALDDVAAGTTEDDVAGAEAGDTRAEELLQPGDQGNAFGGQRTTQRAVLGDLRGIGVIAPQEVAELRSRQALDEGEAVEDAEVGGWKRRFEEVVDDHVGKHADIVELVADPVEAGTAVEVVGAFGGEEDVVTAFADHLIETAAKHHGIRPR